MQERPRVIPDVRENAALAVQGLPLLIERYGGPLSGALLGPGCRVYRGADPSGIIGYRTCFRSAVVLGDPICRPEDCEGLVDAFRGFCRAQGARLVYAAVGSRVAAMAVARGCAAVQFGEELILDSAARTDAGAAGRELRKKVRRATDSGVVVLEYRRSANGHGGDVALEGEMQSVAAAWLDARRGPQMFLAPVRLFTPAQTQRWFLARATSGRVEGVLALLRLDTRGGWLAEHILFRPDAPRGTSELLIVRTLEALRRDGTASLSLGIAPSDTLGEVAGVGSAAERALRVAYEGLGRVFRLGAKGRYRRKFQGARSEPIFVVFEGGPRLGHMLGLLRAFNLSIA